MNYSALFVGKGNTELRIESDSNAGYIDIVFKKTGGKKTSLIRISKDIFDSYELAQLPVVLDQMVDSVFGKEEGEEE